MIFPALHERRKLGKQNSKPLFRQSPSAGEGACQFPLVEILCAARSSVYQAVPSALVRTKTNSAWQTTGSCPVIAHPPCRFWSRSRSRASGTLRERIEEMLLGMICIREVLRRGGVLEQPAHSRLFTVAGMPTPSGPGHQPKLWTMSINQYHFGHRVSKPTWLLVVGVLQCDMPSAPFGLRQDPQRRLDAITPGQRSATPTRFADWLLSIATRVVKPITPR